MTASIIVLFIAAVFGVYILSFILRDKETPKMFVILHSIFALSGLTIVVVLAMQAKEGLLNISIYFFIAAALAGIALVYKDVIKQRAPSKKLAIIHPILALIGLILLILFAIFE